MTETSISEPLALDAVAGGYAVGSDVPPLFRPEALAAAADRGFGQPVALFPISWSLLTGILAVMATAFVALLLVGSYTRKESAAGIVRSVGGDVRVAPSAPGVIDKVLVREGEPVHAGQTLATITTARSSLDGRPADRAAIASLDLELANLGQRLASLDAAAEVNRSAGPERLAALKNELITSQAQEASSRERLSLARAARTKVMPVAERGFISEESMRRRLDEIISLQQSVEEAQGAQARLKGQISDLRSTIAQQPMTLTQERGQVLDLMARARRDRLEYSERQGYALVAATSGKATAVQAVQGQQVDPQSTLMTISASKPGVLAEIFVPSRAIGFLEPGQKVRVRYDAFPYQRFGSAVGRVQAISAGVLKPQEVDAAIKVDEAVYRVLIRLNGDTVSAYGTKHRIKPGFALTADVVIEERSFGRWLLDPIASLKGNL
ncbi:HlyD family secretion protein [Sphingomonas bacterium]|uniref:HlyD family secretion protein n=1 Tax=Sphingomonas bacterium TaxID=1895847 RepID=UPI001575C113|nr:HlyD family efflux transporter periplasmic adaptor subunit [Sphingomonas bacterium]